jgi:RNA polymerase sigma factor (sigma-70 family)
MYTHHQHEDGFGWRTEAVLFREAQAGCRECLNALMKAHDGLVHAVVRRQVLGELPYGEAIQAGRIGLWRAILGYGPGRGYAFSTYAWRSIVHHVWRAVKVHSREACADRTALPAGGSAQWRWMACVDPALRYQGQCVHRALYDLVARLPERLRWVILCRYGLGSGKTRLYREIGQQLGLSGERARQLHSEALVRLRHPARSQHLRSLLGRHRVSDYAWAEAQAQRWLRKRGGRHG